MESLGEKNQTAVTEFILLGYGSVPDTQVLPFVVFLLIYMGTVLENTVMVLIIRINPCLHTPMYFFLMNLSLLDLSYSSTIAPKAMATFLRGSKAISYNGCAAQLFFFALFVTTEAFILAAMAYDRYTAICDPLLYPVTMSKRVCVQLLVGSYICGGTNYLVQTSFTFTLSYCGPKEINHFFCDGPPLLNLSCTNMYSSELMFKESYTVMKEFILMGFTSGAGIQVLPFVVFLVIYTATVLGNSIMVLIIRTDSRLHIPMYFFLINLSLLDLCYSSTIAPKAMATFLQGSKTISYNGCAAQFFFFILFATTEAFILAAMAHDRYIAISNPLLYPVIVSKWVCIQLIMGSYISGVTTSIVQTIFTFTLSYCGPQEINHFFCDVPVLINLSCTTDKHINELVTFLLGGLIIGITSRITLISYAYIIYTILRIRSAKGRLRTLSTCSSHMLVVTLFFGTVFFIYAQPGSLYSPHQSKIVSVFYTLVIPMLNPYIYSLRNKDVKEALRRIIGRKITSK
ncbi:olfactory receptor 5AR1-like [Alligator mississippiensis]|uniref:olfactory receptor 5AR1-like n=1 Tax=Alligator mississippiensis TaxID=8496 RepID=UPI002877BBBC|nr:olfactory receptor 5AR1-like [Alligator mississippiensis]